MLRAVTSPAEPENSPNAIDGIAFILQKVVATPDSDTNIQNIFNITISIYCDTLSLVLLEIISEGNQERNFLEIAPVSGLCIDEQIPAMSLVFLQIQIPLPRIVCHRYLNNAVR